MTRQRAVRWPRGRVAIAGYAQTPIARRSAEPLGSLAVGAARTAIADSGLSPQDIDAFVTVSGMPSLGAHAAEDGITAVSAEWLVSQLNVVPDFVANVHGIGQLTGALSVAVHAIASGAVNTALVYRALHNPLGGYHDNPLPAAEGALQWTAPQGYFGPLAAIALPTAEYFHRYAPETGTDERTLAAIVAEARKNGARIPWSYWHDNPLADGEHADAPQLVDPIRRADCDLPVDAVAAFVLTSAERARDFPHAPVYVSGLAMGTASPMARRRVMLHWPLDDIMAGGAATVNNLWAASGLSLADVDLPQVYDGFSPFVLFWLEALGLCPVGDAHRYVGTGAIDSDIPGSMPVLSGGGSLGNGRMHGAAQLLECYLQLSGRAAERQRQSVNVALACYGPPHSGGAIALSTAAN